MLTATLLLASFIAPSHAHAMECFDVEYPDTIQVDGQTLVLNGMGLRPGPLVVKVYMAGAYVTKKARTSKELLDLSTPKRVVVTFMRDVSKKQVATAYRQNLERAPDDIHPQITEDYENIIAKLQAAEKGQTHVFTYIPNVGLKIETIGKHRVTITNRVMIEYFLGLYMGPNPRFQKMRDGIVTGKCQ